MRLKVIQWMAVLLLLATNLQAQSIVLLSVSWCFYFKVSKFFVV